MLLVWISALLHAVASQPNTYIALQNMDAPDQDICQVGSVNVSYLEILCDSLDNCAGFNNQGWMKTNVSASVLAPSNGSTLYIRTNAVNSPPPTLLWPLPQSFVSGSACFGIDPATFDWISDPPFADLTEAFLRYSEIIFSQALGGGGLSDGDGDRRIRRRPSHPPPPPSQSARLAVRHRRSGSSSRRAGGGGTEGGAGAAAEAWCTSTLLALNVSVSDPLAPLQMGVDESYVLSVADPDEGDGVATLQANTYYGALRGLETFAQLIAFNYSAMNYQLTNAPWVIKDWPRFVHRGLLIDTSRHYQPMRLLKRAVDAMAYSKLNVLHWHLSDTQAFPLQSFAAPLLWNGAFSPAERFTQEDAAYLIEYARQRGVRVVPEFDVPGHAGSWCVGYPEVCPSPQCNQPLNPATNDTWNLITDLFAELFGGDMKDSPSQDDAAEGYDAEGSASPLFLDSVVHVGGDEVDTSCWLQSPQINSWLNAHNFTVEQAYGYFVQRVHTIGDANNRTPMNWEEVFDNFGSALAPDTIIQIWLSQATLARVVAAGFRGVLSNANAWYLPHLESTWADMYLNEPYYNITDPGQQTLVLGGEACMWGEWVDASDFEQTIWPRSAAVAERLWSSAQVNDVLLALPRLSWFRCLLNQRGIAAAPVNNDEARSSPAGPGSCYVQ